jgi:hypothetical protein
LICNIISVFFYIWCSFEAVSWPRDFVCWCHICIETRLLKLIKTFRNKTILICLFILTQNNLVLNFIKLRFNVIVQNFLHLLLISDYYLMFILEWLQLLESLFKFLLKFLSLFLLFWIGSEI